MSMFDSLKSKLGIDSEADSYVDDTEDEIFPGGQGGAAAQGYTQQEVKQHSCRSFWSSRNALRMPPPLQISSTPSIRWC